MESELNFNVTTVNRSKGSKILLKNSRFMLLHVNTMRYVSLNMENKENL